MQQTETYKLNIIETSDTFSPEALNDNARTLETQLARVDAALAAKAAQSEITRINATLLKFTFGTYTGNGTADRKISLPFTPRLVYVGAGAGSISDYGYCSGGVALTGKPAGTSNGITVEIVDGGFLVSYRVNNTSSNTSNIEYRYFAFA